MKTLDFAYTKWEKTKHFFGMIWFIIKEAVLLLTKKWFWMIVAFIVWSYGLAWFNANYVIKVNFKWGIYERANKIVDPSKNASSEHISTQSATLVKTVVAKEIKPTTIAPHKKFLTQQQYENQQFARKYFEAFYDADEVQAIDNVILSEGWYQPDIKNPDSGACGLGQALPCEKMGCPLDQTGLECQLEWTMNYVNTRYDNPIKAWKFRQKMGWY